MESITNKSLDLIIEGCRELRSDPEFPDTEKDICIVKQGFRRNLFHGYDNVYIVWRKNDGELGCKLLETSYSTGHCLYVNDIMKKDNQIIVGIKSNDPCLPELKARRGSYTVEYSIERSNSDIVIKRMNLKESDLFKKNENR